MQDKSTLVRIGDFFFKYRNQLFPFLLLGIFLLRIPPSEYYGDPHLEALKDWVAIGVMLSGLGLRAAVIGFKYIKRGGVNKKVYAENLVTDGFFATCRNPLYVGNIIMYAGIFLMHGDPLVFFTGMAVFLFIYTAIIAAEEYFLRHEFGAAYEAYCRDVPRWLPKLSRLKGATEGMEFNWRRVIAKDYSTIVNGLFALLVIECWEQLAAHEPVRWALYGWLLLSLVVLLAGVKWAKKRGSFGAV